MIVVEQVKPTVIHTLEKGNIHVEFEPFGLQVRVREYYEGKCVSLKYLPIARARDLYRWLKDTEGYAAW